MDTRAPVQGDASVPDDWLRRLRWRARRGLLENDLIMTRFFDSRQNNLTVHDHNGLAEILELSDNDLLDLVIGRKPADALLKSAEAKVVLKQLQAL